MRSATRHARGTEHLERFVRARDCAERVFEEKARSTIRSIVTTNRRIWILAPLAALAFLAHAGEPAPASGNPVSPGRQFAGEARPDAKTATQKTAAATLPDRSADAVTGVEIPQDGVERIQFREIFKPVGRRGLEYSEKIQALDQKRVRILGYMARQEKGAPGLFLLSPFPLVLHEEEYGLCDDLPASTVHVFLVAEEREKPVPFTRGLLLLTGTLSLGPREEPDGRVSTVRITLDPRGQGKEPISQPVVARTTDKKTEGPPPGDRKPSASKDSAQINSDKPGEKNEK